MRDAKLLAGALILLLACATAIAQRQPDRKTSGSYTLEAPQKKIEQKSTGPVILFPRPEGQPDPLLDFERFGRGLFLELPELPEGAKQESVRYPKARVILQYEPLPEGIPGFWDAPPQDSACEPFRLTLHEFPVWKCPEPKPAPRKA